ncbi:MAG: hypothetical protein M3530_01910 [Thermoproteota archaeon]|nr:hypothetical protein [Thermoproteota archaeon]
MKEQSIVYVKHNKARFILGKRTEGLRILQEFFTENHNDIKGLSGYIIIKSEEDAQEAIALTFLEIQRGHGFVPQLKEHVFC